MCYFIQITNLDCNKKTLPFPRITDLENCYKKYFKYFQDDFSGMSENVYEYISKMAPYFWLIYSQDNRFMGFVCLDNFIGDGKTLYSAEITTCFCKYAWGIFPRYSAKFFLKYCFDKFKFEKIKAQIYPDNFRVRRFLNDCGFIYESTLKNETLRNKTPQDIEVYSLYKSYYYGNEVKND